MVISIKKNLCLLRKLRYCFFQDVFEPWWSEAEHATSRSRKLPTTLNIYECAGKKQWSYSETWIPERGINTQAAMWQAFGVTPTRGPPANTRRWINVGLTLTHRLRRLTNVKQTLIQRLVSDGLAHQNKYRKHEIGWVGLLVLHNITSRYP